MQCQLAVLMAKQRPRVSQRVLAEATGLSTHTISQLCQDRAKRMDYATVEKLCAYFGCGIGDLFTLEGVSAAN